MLKLVEVPVAVSSDTCLSQAGCMDLDRRAIGRKMIRRGKRDVTLRATRLRQASEHHADSKRLAQIDIAIFRDPPSRSTWVPRHFGVYKYALLATFQHGVYSFWVTISSTLLSLDRYKLSRQFVSAVLGLFPRNLSS